MRFRETYNSPIEELRTKYPTSKYAPAKDCPYCHGKGEKTTHIQKSEFFEEQDVISPCICIYVDHDFVPKIAPVLGKLAAELRQEMIDEQEGGEE
jgi:hypothetical protein